MLIFYIRSFIIFLIFSLFYCCNNDKNVENKMLDKSSIKPVVPERIYFELHLNASAIDDFNEAIQNKDFRFIGILEYSLVVPGVKNYYEGYDKSNGVKIIEGTSDSFTYKDSSNFKNTEFFKKYAVSYNNLLLGYLEKNN